MKNKPKKSNQSKFIGWVGSPSVRIFSPPEGLWHVSIKPWYHPVVNATRGHSSKDVPYYPSLNTSDRLQTPGRATLQNYELSKLLKINH